MRAPCLPFEGGARPLLPPVVAVPAPSADGVSVVLAAHAAAPSKLREAFSLLEDDIETLRAELAQRRPANGRDYDALRRDPEENLSASVASCSPLAGPRRCRAQHFSFVCAWTFYDLTVTYYSQLFNLPCSLLWWRNLSNLFGLTLGRKFSSKLWNSGSPGLQGCKSGRELASRSAAPSFGKHGGGGMAAAAAAEAVREAQRRALSAPPAALPAIPRRTRPSLIRRQRSAAHLTFRLVLPARPMRSLHRLLLRRFGASPRTRWARRRASPRRDRARATAFSDRLVGRFPIHLCSSGLDGPPWLGPKGCEACAATRSRMLGLSGPRSLRRLPTHALGSPASCVASPGRLGGRGVPRPLGWKMVSSSTAPQGCFAGLHGSAPRDAP